MHIGWRFDQHEGNTGIFALAGVAPFVIGAALDDDRVRSSGGLDSIFKLNFNLDREDDAIIDAVGAVHG